MSEATLSSRGGRMLAVACALFTFLLVQAVSDARASHLRYSSISAQATGGTSYAVTFSEAEAGCSAVSSSFAALQLFYGDGASASPTATVSSSACAGSYLWHYGSNTTSKTYAGGLNGQAVTLSSYGSCRVTLNNTPFNCIMRSESSFVVGSGDSTPTASVPPVVYCQSSAICSFAVPAADIDGDTLRWRMSTLAETGGTGQPTGMTVNATTGLVSWDTTGLASGLWAANVTVEELNGVGAVKGKTSADFILAAGSYALPVFSAPTPANGTTFNLTQGESFQLPLAVTAPSGQTVTLSSLGLPSWLTCVFPAAGATATATCTGTAPSQAASTTVVFLGTSSAGPSSSVSFGINVSLRPTAASGVLTAVSGAAGTVGALAATSPDASPLTFQITSQPTQGSATITNAATGSFTFDANAGATGSDSFTFTATNAAGTSNTATITVSYTLSAAATLSGINLDTSTLAPAFTSATTSYTALVSAVVTGISITPSTVNSGATLRVRARGGTWVSGSSGLPVGPVPLDEGDNTIEIEVTAQDGTTVQVYTLVVTRSVPVVALPPAPPAPESISVEAVPPPTPPTVLTAVQRLVTVPKVGGIYPSHTVSIRVDNVDPGEHVRVFTDLDQGEVQEAVVAADGTITVTFPDSAEGRVQVFIARVRDGATAATTVDIDTIEPVIGSALQAPASAGQSIASLSSPTSRTGKRRVWFNLAGTDTGSGVYSLQLSPRPGKVWAWRSVLASFSAPTSRDTIDIRIADKAGNISGWKTIQLTRSP